MIKLGRNSLDYKDLAPFFVNQAVTPAEHSAHVAPLYYITEFESKGKVFQKAVWFDSSTNRLYQSMDYRVIDMLTFHAKTTDADDILKFTVPKQIQR